MKQEEPHRVGGGAMMTWRGFLFSKCGLGSSRRRFCKPVYISSSTTCECLIKKTTHLSAAPQSRRSSKGATALETHKTLQVQFLHSWIKSSGTEAMSGKGEELSYREAIEMAHESIMRFPLIPVQGVPLMSLIANDWDNVWTFRPDPSDILIATYPKAGTDRHNSSLCIQNSGLGLVHTIILVLLFAGMCRTLCHLRFTVKCLQSWHVCMIRILWFEKCYQKIKYTG